MVHMFDSSCSNLPGVETRWLSRTTASSIKNGIFNYYLIVRVVSKLSVAKGFELNGGIEACGSHKDAW